MQYFGFSLLCFLQFGFCGVTCIIQRILVYNCIVAMQAFNKRATAFYLARDFERSIDDCHRTLKLQPDHFLAMSGMGLCYAGLERWDEAIHWFQKSVTIHPHMDQIQTYITKLKSKGFGGTSSL